MNWKSVFLRADGRLGRKDFWIAVLLLAIVKAVLQLIPVLGVILTLALIYPYVCVMAKRLHDFGHNGWLAAVPYGVAAVVLLLLGIAVGLGLLGSVDNPGAWRLAILIPLGVVALAGTLGFLLWVGLRRGDAGPNAYGPPPTPGLSAAGPSPA